MSGVMAAVAGGAQNVIYAAGLYNTSYGVETSPVDYSASSVNGALNFTYTWVGYYRPAATGTVAIGMAGSYAEYLSTYGPYSWGGNGYVAAYLWLGNTAKSGYTGGNANVTIYNNTSSYSPSLIAGIYYPIRIQMTMVLPYQYPYFNFYTAYANGAFSFLSNGSTDTNTLIWYNRLSNGF